MSKPDFNSFIVSDSNKKAFEFCCDFVCDKQKGYILSLYGPGACGKTYLINAIQCFVEEDFPNKKINRLPFFSFSESLTAKTLGLYYEMFSNSDLLIIDDLQVIKCKSFFQEVFAEIASNVLMNGGNVVVAFDCPISSLKKFFDNIHFASCNQKVEIKYPDMKLIREFLKVKQKECDVKLSKIEEDKLIRSRWLGVLHWYSDVSWKQTCQDIIDTYNKLFK